MEPNLAAAVQAPRACHRTQASKRGTAGMGGRLEGQPPQRLVCRRRRLRKRHQDDGHRDTADLTANVEQLAIARSRCIRTMNATRIWSASLSSCRCTAWVKADISLPASRSDFDPKRLTISECVRSSPWWGVVKSLGYYRRGPVGLVHTRKAGIKYKKPTSPNSW